MIKAIITLNRVR